MIALLSMLSAVKQVQKAAGPVDHLGAALDGEGLAQGLAADGQAGDQRGDRHAQQHVLDAEGRLEPGDDDGGGGTADDAADAQDKR